MKKLKKMKAKSDTTKLIFLVMSCFMCCMTFSCPVFAASTSSNVPPIEDTVNRLQAIYENTRDFQADFTQTTRVSSIGKTEIEEGTVYFKNPKQMFWDYKKPTEKKLIINATSAWLYLPREKTVYTQKADELFRSGALIKFLSGIGKLKDDFEIAYASPTPCDEKGNYLLELTPRQQSVAYQFLKMTLDKDNYFIASVSFDDVAGNTTILKFSGIRLNRGLSAKLFSFQPPKGVSVFKMP